jgi:hypothetical protein
MSLSCKKTSGSFLLPKSNSNTSKVRGREVFKPVLWLFCVAFALALLKTSRAKDFGN